METKLSYYCFTPHLRILRRCGYFKMDSNAPEIQKVLHSVYRRLVFGLLALYITQQCMKVYQLLLLHQAQIRSCIEYCYHLWDGSAIYQLAALDSAKKCARRFIHDPELIHAKLHSLEQWCKVRNNSVQVMDTLFLCLTNTNTLIKVYILWVRAPLIEELLAIMKGPLFNQGLPSHDKLLRATCRHAYRFLRFFQCLPLSTVVVWTVYPVVLHLRGIHQPFTIWLPFDETVDPQFYIAIAYAWLQVSWVAIGASTADSFITFMFVQSKTQIAILRLDLETLVEKSKEVASETSIEFTTALALRFKAIMAHYEEIDTFNKKLQKSFGTVIFIQFLLSGWLLCATIYHMTGLSSFVDFVSTVMYLMCVLWEISLYCYYGNDLHVESTALLDSAYMMDWVQLPLSQRRTFIIFMERLKRPMLLLGGGIIPLTNDTFLTILRSGYSFYAFLRNSTAK